MPLAAMSLFVAAVIVFALAMFRSPREDGRMTFLLALIARAARDNQ